MKSNAPDAAPSPPPQGGAAAPDAQFWDVVDTLIEAANAQCDQASRTKVSAAMLFAAARFNTFVVAAAAGNGDDLVARREEIVAYLTGQYTAMLRDNLAEYAANFARYAPQRASPGASTDAPPQASTDAPLHTSTGASSKDAPPR